MAKTITLSDTSLQSIVINKIPEQVGYTCTVSYSVNDSKGDTAKFGSTMKYTTDTDYEDKLSSDSDKLVTDFIVAIQANMNAKEEL
jgi:hypothetical protein